MRRAIAAVLLATLALTAGCGGIGGGETTAETPAAETTTTTTTPTAAETTATTPTREPVAVDGFPAVDGTTVNETLLVATHDRVLGGANGSYTLALQQRVDDTNVSVDAAREGDEELLTTTVNGTAETDYTNGSTEYIRSETGNGSVEYSSRTVANYTPYTGEVVVDDFVDSADHAPVATTTYEGVEVVELTATRPDIKPDALVENTTVEAFESRLLVDREGRIRLFTYRIAGTTDGEPFSFRLRFRLFDVGTTSVERPEWVDRV